MALGSLFQGLPLPSPALLTWLRRLTLTDPIDIAISTHTHKRKKQDKRLSRTEQQQELSPTVSSTQAEDKGRAQRKETT